MFDQRFTRIVQEKALAAIKDAFTNDPTLKDIAVTYGGGTIGMGKENATLKFAFLNSKAKPTAAFGVELNNDSVREGLANAGVEVMYGGRRYRVIKARQVRYLAICLEDGKSYTLPFGGCSLAPAKVG